MLKVWKISFHNKKLACLTPDLQIQRDKVKDKDKNKVLIQSLRLLEAEGIYITLSQKGRMLALNEEAAHSDHYPLLRT